MRRKLFSLGVAALLLGALSVPALTAGAADDRLSPRDRLELGRDTPELQWKTADPGLWDLFQEIWERIFHLIPRLPGPEGEKEPQKPEAAPTIDPLGWAPNGG